MALGTATVDLSIGGDLRPVFHESLTFLGDGAYTAGGTPNFTAYVRNAVGKGALEILDIIAGDCGGYVPQFDRANDKLKVYEQTDTATTPLIETATANLSGVTFQLTVIAR